MENNVIDSVAKIFSCYNKDLTSVVTKAHVNDFLAKMDSKISTTRNTYTLMEFYDLIIDISQLEVIFSLSSDSGNIGDIVTSFFHLDQNEDGCISKDDLLSALIELGLEPSLTDISILHSKLDIKSNGCPSLKEYTSAVTNGML
jgi:Ca2+-binding EF-hand superfamily protein